MKDVFLIITYDMGDGWIFKTYQPSGFNENSIKEVGGKLVLLNGKLPNSFHLSFEKEGVEYDDKGLLPYKAKVTQDLPGGCNFPPETYDNCQLMMETKGGYKYFKNLDTGEKLLIAINSHIFEEIKS